MVKNRKGDTEMKNAKNYDIIDKIAIFIKNNNITYDEFGKMIGVSHVTISRWIRGERNISPRYHNIIKAILNENNSKEEAYILLHMNINIALKYINSLDKGQRKNIAKTIIENL